MRQRQPPNGLTAVVPLLACPHCAVALDLVDPAVAGCGNGHRFDIARQGYLSLLGKRSRTDTADTADMVAARVAFLEAGHYRPIAQAVAKRCRPGAVLEVGAGTGYYLAAALDRWSGSSVEAGGVVAGPVAAGSRDAGGVATGSGDAGDGVAGGVEAGRCDADPPVVGLAIDASRFAAGRAAAAHQGIGSIVADAWSRLPVRDAVAGTVLSVFAPRDPGEITRVLAPGGLAIVVTPEPDHLIEIRGSVGLLSVDAGKSERLAQAFAGMLAVADRCPVRASMALSRRDVSALVRMGPSARHIGPAQLAQGLDTLDEHTTVTLSVTVTVLRADHL